MKNYKRLLMYIKPYTRRLVAAVFCIIMAAGANLYLPWIIKDMIDKVLMERDMYMLNLIALGILVVMFIRGVFYYGQSYLVSYVGEKVIIDVRSILFRKFQKMPLSYYDKQQTGTVMSYITNDVSA
ncbi:MAG: ABC transporter ATP-binding protein, partial [Anaerovibrio sp.]|nr:ABC transporter ATP-binding protein [Anaerovibrio sp.]